MTTKSRIYCADCAYWDSDTEECVHPVAGNTLVRTPPEVTWCEHGEEKSGGRETKWKL